MPLRRNFISAITIHVYMKAERLAASKSMIWNRPHPRPGCASLGNAVRIFYKS